MNKEELKAKIVSANKAYRSGTELMTDAEFDALLEEYEKACDGEEFEAFRNSLHEVSGKVRNRLVLGSLTKLKVQEPDDIRKFVSKYVKTGLNVSAKVDGISSRVCYRAGRLVSANTRGDGYYGEDLTDKIFFVKGIPHEIPYKDDIDIRGELVILKDDFAKMGSDKNSRNVCAGIMNRKKTSKEWNEDDLKLVSFVPYAILDTVHAKKEQFEMLEEFGFSTAWHRSFEPGYFEKNGLDMVDELAKYALQDLPYAIDGVVISDDSYVNEEKYRPDAQMAVKTNTLDAVTTLLDIEFEGPKKDGAHVPVAVLEPVEIGEAVIGRASVHNLDFIAEKGLKCGCLVHVVKGGDIIPTIESVVSTPDNAVEIDLPEVCNCCGEKLARDGVNLRCVNSECRDQKIYRVMHFIKKLGVMNVSFKTLDNFDIDSFEKLVSFVPDKSFKAQVKLGDELYEKVFSRSEQDLFCAMNIRGLGETLQKKIVDHYGWGEVKAGRFEGSLPDGIGDITLDAFKESRAGNLESLTLFTGDVRYHYSAPVVSAKTEKKGSVCFTGSLNTMGRKQASDLAVKAGYEVKSSVSKGLTYLVTNDKNSGSSKNEKARKFGTKVIDENEFLELVNNKKVEMDISSL